MGLTTALYTGLSGLNANQLRINTIGHNIANVNTTAFKASRALFQSQFSQTISTGTGPSEVSGGVNPTQIGLGAVLGQIQRNHNAGSIETTGVPSDMAIEGNGFFILRKGESQQVYTRDGAFTVGPDNRLVSADGHRVQGFGIDEGFNIVPGVLGDLEIPLGTQTVARATENVSMDGDLSAVGVPATKSSIHMSQALADANGDVATGSTALTALRSADDPSIALFAADTTITVSGVTKGERELPGQTFVVGTTGNTLGDFAAWLQSALGINTDSGLPGQPGVTVENGMLTVHGNTGEQNDLSFSINDIATDNQAAPNPLLLTRSQAATGSSAYTSLTVYDSLGTPVSVNLTMALESTTNAGPVWRFYAESPDSSGGSRVLGTGTISFDNEGNFLAATGTQLSLDRSNSGAATPLTFTLDFSPVHGLSTRNSEVILASQDGYEPGTLTNYAIQTDGTITGTFDNGLSRTLGQVALAAFDNPEGLVADTDNTYLAGPNADPPTVTTPGTFGAGRILAGSLEASNVDLSNEFIGLVTSSTGFQAASRVITVSSDLLNQLLLIAR